MSAKMMMSAATAMGIAIHNAGILFLTSSLMVVEPPDGGYVGGNVGSNVGSNVGANVVCGVATPTSPARTWDSDCEGAGVVCDRQKASTWKHKR